MPTLLLLQTCGLLALGSASPLLVERFPNGLLSLRLNRPAKLNALSSELVGALRSELSAARKDKDGVSAILLTAEPGRAFCAGGDIKEVASMQREDAKAFLTDEYELCLWLHELSSELPVVALADGIVFGAGAGLFMSASVRVASSASSFSMPECAIGLVPDTGATDFLGLLPPPLGMWAALTGARLDASMMVACEISTHTLRPPASVNALHDALASAEILTTGSVLELVEAHADSLDTARTAAEALGSPSVGANADGTAAYDDDDDRVLLEAARRVFGGEDQTDDRCAEHASKHLEGIFHRISEEEEAAAAEGDARREAWARDTREKLVRGSPAALVLTYAARRADLGADPSLRRARALGLERVANEGLAALPDFA